MGADQQSSGAARWSGERFQQLAFVLVCAYLAWRTLTRVAAAWSFTTDDAYITLRYARHLFAGQGLVWNLGEAPVEGYSNFAYVLIAAGFAALGELEATPLKLIGCLALVALAYFQWALARRFMRPLPALLPFAFYSLQRGATWWSVSGLETSVYVAVCCAVVLASLRGLGFERVDPREPLGDGLGLARGPLRPRALALAGGLCLLACLLRPEAPLLALAVGIAASAQLMIDRRSQGSRFDAHGYRRAALGFVAVFVPLMLIYAGWRFAYFGELVPNTVRCKTGHVGADRFVLLAAYWSAAPLSLVLAVIWPLRRLDARVLLPLSLALLYALALVGADPLIGHDLRHLLAVHALVCVLAAATALRLAAWVARGLAPRHVELGLVLLILVVATPLGRLPERDDLRGRAGAYAARTKARAALGEYLGRALEPGEQALLGDVGVAGWTGDAALIDAFCLNTPALAKPPLRGDPARQVDWILDEQRPQVIVVHSRSPKKMQPRGKIYRELITRPGFETGWREQRRFNAKRGDFHYVVFRRVDPQP